MPYDSITPFGLTQSSHRRYKCPRCGGEFDTWDTDGLGTDRTQRCPFCGQEKYEHGFSVDTPQTSTWG